MLKLRRSVLFVPGSNLRALEKAKTLYADVLILDLEDAVSLSEKDEARKNVAEFLAVKNYKASEVVVRVNTAASGFLEKDIAAIKPADPHAIMLPKVEHAGEVDFLVSWSENHHVWCNIETPLGIMNLREIASHKSVAALVAGTNDLFDRMNIRPSLERFGITPHLAAIVLAARAFGKLAIDGTYTNFKDESGFLVQGEHGKALGFDGKTLIHPSQIELANRIFSPSKEESEWAEKVVREFRVAEAKGKVVAAVDGKMIEELHYKNALLLLEKNRRADEK